MKRIDIAEMREFINSGSAVLYVAQGINEIMDYLENNLPAKNGEFWKCSNCGNVSAYTGTCPCGNPDYELYTG